jgi:hypothetical protein
MDSELTVSKFELNYRPPEELSTHETNLVYESFSVGSLHFVIFEIGGSLSSMTLRCGDDDDADLCYDYVLHPLS